MQASDRARILEKPPIIRTPRKQAERIFNIFDLPYPPPPDDFFHEEAYRPVRELTQAQIDNLQDTKIIDVFKLEDKSFKERYPEAYAANLARAMNLSKRDNMQLEHLPFLFVLVRLFRLNVPLDAEGSTLEAYQANLEQILNLTHTQVHNLSSPCFRVLFGLQDLKIKPPEIFGELDLATYQATLAEAMSCTIPMENEGVVRSILFKEADVKEKDHFFQLYDEAFKTAQPEAYKANRLQVLTLTENNFDNLYSSAIQEIFKLADMTFKAAYPLTYKENFDRAIKLERSQRIRLENTDIFNIFHLANSPGDMELNPDYNLRLQLVLDMNYAQFKNLTMRNKIICLDKPVKPTKRKRMGIVCQVFHLNHERALKAFDAAYLARLKEALALKEWDYVTLSEKGVRSTFHLDEALDMRGPDYSRRLTKALALKEYQFWRLRYAGFRNIFNLDEPFDKRGSDYSIRLDQALELPLNVASALCREIVQRLFLLDVGPTERDAAYQERLQQAIELDSHVNYSNLISTHNGWDNLDDLDIRFIYDLNRDFDERDTGYTERLHKAVQLSINEYRLLKTRIIRVVFALDLPVTERDDSYSDRLQQALSWAHNADSIFFSTPEDHDKSAAISRLQWPVIVNIFYLDQPFRDRDIAAYQARLETAMSLPIDKVRFLKESEGWLSNRLLNLTMPIAERDADHEQRLRWFLTLTIEQLKVIFHPDLQVIFNLNQPIAERDPAYEERLSFFLTLDKEKLERFSDPNLQVIFNLNQPIAERDAQDYNERLSMVLSLTDEEVKNLKRPLSGLVFGAGIGAGADATGAATGAASGVVQGTPGSFF